jgi:excinuclease ABC subunit C
VGRIDKDEYSAHLKEFIGFLRGKHNSTSQKLKREMRLASKEENFEEAALYRDKLQAIDILNEKSSVMLGDRESLDVIGFAEDELRAVAHIFFVRFGRLIGERQILLENTEGSNALYEQILMELYFDSEVDVLRNTLSTDAFTIPKEILLEGGFEQKDSIEKLLEGKALRKIKIFTPQRGEKHALLIRAKENADQGLFAYKLKRKNDFIARTAALNELKEKLMLAKAPYRIECYDNSHIQGTNRVSSMVVFEDGLPKNKDYRHFIVKNIFDDVRRDDTQAMYELLRRRLAYLSEDNTYESDESLTTCPDLIVIDGGKGQLRYAYKAYKDSGVSKKIEFVSLAKRLEEVFLVGRSESVMLPRNSDALFMLQFLRDESHRFAIEFHRLRRQKSMTKSKLDSIQGLGESKKNALLKRFGSVKGIASATKDQLMEVDGIGAKLAETIMNAVAS